MLWCSDVKGHSTTVSLFIDIKRQTPKVNSFKAFRRSSVTLRIGVI